MNCEISLSRLNLSRFQKSQTENIWLLFQQSVKPVAGCDIVWPSGYLSVTWLSTTQAAGGWGGLAGTTLTSQPSTVSPSELEAEQVRRPKSISEVTGWLRTLVRPDTVNLISVMWTSGWWHVTMHQSPIVRECEGLAAVVKCPPVFCGRGVSVHPAHHTQVSPDICSQRGFHPSWAANWRIWNSYKWVN